MKGRLLVAALLLACASVQAQVQDDNVTPEFRRWMAANPWYGKDLDRTAYARGYMKNLMENRPELQGRALLDEVSRKTREHFAGKAQKR